MHVALKPLRVQVRAEPVGVLLGQGIERRAHALPHTFQATKRAHAGQHRRGIGALLAACFEPAALPTQLQDRLQDQLLRLSGQQALAEVGQERVIEARIIQGQGQGIQPVNARAHTLSGLAIGQSLDGLQHRHQCQPPRGFCRPSPFGKQLGKVLIAIDGTKGIAQLRHQRPFGAQALDQPTRFFRDGLQAMGFQRHRSPRFLFQQGRPSASHWLRSFPESTTSDLFTCLDRVSQQSHKSAPTGVPSPFTRPLLFR